MRDSFAPKVPPLGLILFTFFMLLGFKRDLVQELQLRQRMLLCSESRIIDSIRIDAKLEKKSDEDGKKQHNQQTLIYTYVAVGDMIAGTKEIRNLLSKMRPASL